ncbi:hypothetical protein [Secundilactobacillus kimchicus]|uniref:hypothetical protein n=1 Tax=Secundilactobacillus kimchicus TaxID=528209 RepID=UPI0024A8A56E|nr:hypothetical protein [Secundilactobacillus kimchicus]
MAYDEKLAKFLISVGSKNRYIEGDDNGFTALMFDQQDVWDTASALIESKVLDAHLEWESGGSVDIIWNGHE